MITFQDYFKNDEVDLKVSDKVIFKGEVITSAIVGVTDVEIAFTKRKRNELLAKYGSNGVLIIDRNWQTIVIKLNGRITKVQVNLDNGKYLGFSKKDENELYFEQRKIPFVYD